ncbi:MAG: protein kinase [Chloroflexota bacterium]|nr:protein kinase [Chloroflexota bacterium]
MKEKHGPGKEQHGLQGDGQHKSSFGHYDLVRRIDVGGMGEVYLARQRTAFGREVALKVIRSDLVHDITARKRFLREAEVSAHLKHEHILPLYEFGEEQGRLFLVTPYIEGGTLASRLQAGPLSLSETHQLFTALVRAVAYVHKRGVVHRDLKPSNILLDTEEGTGQVYVRLIDFGIASLPGVVSDAPLTTAGNEMGTIAYMAPERLNGVAASSNDIYSLGMILYQMLTRQLPGGDQAVTLAQPLDAVVQRAIAPDPRNRFATADELRHAFENAYQAVRQAARPAPLAQNVPATPVVPASQVDATEPAHAEPTQPPTTDKAHTPIPPEPEELGENEPTPRRVAIPRSALPRPAARITQENVAVPRSEMVLAPLPGARFNRSDYNAPTTSFNPSDLQARQGMQHVDDTTSVATKPPVRPRKKRKLSALLIVPILIAVIVLIIFGALFFTLPAFASAKVVISPQAHSISNVYTLTANPGTRSTDVGGHALPANTLTLSKTFTKTGPTSGRRFFCFSNDCPRVVSSDDVYKLSVQLKQEAVTQLTKTVNAQLAEKNDVALGNPSFTDVNYNSNPDIDARSDTVTVSLTEQVSIEYASVSATQDMARQLLQSQVQQQFGQNYALVTPLTQVSQPSVGTVDDNGVATMTIAAGGVAKYQISSAQIASLKNQIKGMKLKSAQDFLARQSGLDAQSTHISLSYGDTLPNNARQITITPVDPATMPTVQMPTVQATPSATATPNN